jgi:methylated-DNA-[protein]-cysteine S-methyltransferase
MTPPRLAYDILPSPLGPIVLECTGEMVTGLRLGGQPSPHATQDPKSVRPFARELIEYLHGERKQFTFRVDQPGTPFQKKVWAKLMAIPYGQTVSYGELAKKIGHPNAYRAVGSANGCNQIAIVIPCHRVIAAGGKLGGYGGELWRKEWLLSLEGGR